MRPASCAPAWHHVPIRGEDGPIYSKHERELDDLVAVEAILMLRRLLPDLLGCLKQIYQWY
jgi:hypothetical protein